MAISISKQNLETKLQDVFSDQSKCIAEIPVFELFVGGVYEFFKEIQISSDCSLSCLSATYQDMTIHLSTTGL